MKKPSRNKYPFLEVPYVSRQTTSIEKTLDLSDGFDYLVLKSLGLFFKKIKEVVAKLFNL